LGLSNCSNIACLTAYGLRLGADLAAWGVWGAGVLRCLPLCPSVLGADFGSALRNDATLVDWAELRLELDFGVADLGGLVDVATERLLPACGVRTLLTSPAVCVGSTGLSKGWV
jgi:hypothetical protein